MMNDEGGMMKMNIQTGEAFLSSFIIHYSSFIPAL